MSFFGSSSRSTWVRLVFSSVAILFLEMFFYFMPRLELSVGADLVVAISVPGSHSRPTYLTEHPKSPNASSPGTRRNCLSVAGPSV